MTEREPHRHTRVATAPETPAPGTTAADPGGFLARRSAARTRVAQQQARPWRRRLALGAVGVVLAVVAFWLVTSLLPIWWAGTVGRQASGTISGAIGWGAFYGFAFTFVPLLIVGVAFVRRWKSVRTRLGFVVAAVLLAGPNLITLSISVGTGSVAHAAERTLDVQAPLFARSVLIAAAVAAVLAAVVCVLSAIRQRAVRELARLRAQRGTATLARDRGRGQT